MNFRPKHQGDRFKLMERGLLVTSDETKALGNLTGFRDKNDLEWVMKALNEHDTNAEELEKYRRVGQILKTIATKFCGEVRPTELLRGDINYLVDILEGKV